MMGHRVSLMCDPRRLACWKEVEEQGREQCQKYRKLRKFKNLLQSRV